RGGGPGLALPPVERLAPLVRDNVLVGQRYPALDDVGPVLRDRDLLRHPRGSFLRVAAAAARPAHSSRRAPRAGLRRSGTIQRQVVDGEDLERVVREFRLPQALVAHVLLAVDQAGAGRL